MNGADLTQDKQRLDHCAHTTRRKRRAEYRRWRKRPVNGPVRAVTKLPENLAADSPGQVDKPMHLGEIAKYIGTRELSRVCHHMRRAERAGVVRKLGEWVATG